MNYHLNNTLAVLFLLLFTKLEVYSQQNVKINGVVKYDSIYLGQINIVNLSTNSGTSSNNKGEFELTCTIGDTLQFSSVQFVSRKIKISQNIITKQKLAVYLEPSVTELEEVMVLEKIKNDWSKFSLPQGAVFEKDATDLNKPPSPKSLTNPTSNGANINILGLLSFFTKNLFKKQREKRKEKNKLSTSKKNFVDTFITKYQTTFYTHKLQIKEVEIYQFIDYCEGNGLAEYYGKPEIDLTNFLVLQAKNFSKLKD